LLQSGSHGGLLGWLVLLVLLGCLAAAWLVAVVGGGI